MASPSTLPTFERPPLTEVFLALQHDPLKKLRTAHLGEFLRAAGPEWIPQPDTAALGQTHEPVGEAVEWMMPGTLAIDIRSGVRLRASRVSADRMLQVENGWLVYNWLEGQQPYIRFEGLRSELEAEIQRWGRYLSDNQIGDLRPNLWEVAYVNVFPKGEFWSSSADWSRILPKLGAPGQGTSSFQSFTGKWAYLIAPGIGRLQVSLEHALHGAPEPKECLLLRFVARGPVLDGSMDGYWRGLALGHQTIVTTFPEWLSAAMKEKLGYKP
jgi:hypothetical protein